MSNRPKEIPLTDFVEVGKLHYRIYKEIWPNGDVKFFYRKGRLATARATGEKFNTGKIYEGASSDDRLIALEVGPLLKSYRTAYEAEREAPESAVSAAPNLEFAEQKTSELKLVS